MIHIDAPKKNGAACILANTASTEDGIEVIIYGSSSLDLSALALALIGQLPEDIRRVLFMTLLENRIVEGLSRPSGVIMPDE